MKISIKIKENEYKFEDFIITHSSNQHKQISDLLHEICITESKLNASISVEPERFIKLNPDINLKV
jgi:hypothetical protein